jgi:hypothetical protein
MRGGTNILGLAMASLDFWGIRWGISDLADGGRDGEAADGGEVAQAGAGDGQVGEAVRVGARGGVARRWDAQVIAALVGVEAGAVEVPPSIPRLRSLAWQTAVHIA